MDFQDGLSAEELKTGAETLDLTEPGKCGTARCDTGGCVMDLLVNLDVDDLEKAVRFYGSAFGLKVGRRFGAFGVEMLGSSAPIYLLVKDRSWGQT